MQNQTISLNLPKTLFWDIDLNTLNVNQNARFIIQRVIQRGSIENWVEIKHFYGIEKIKNEILKIRSLDAKTLNFFSIYFNIPKEHFRCYTTQQSIPQHLNF